MESANAARIAEYWSRADLSAAILSALKAAGKDLDHLGEEDLAATDQFHGGGRPATLRLAALAGLDRPTGARREVLDVGCGLGGPSRTLASCFDCSVTGIDVTESYVEAARMLTDMVGLTDRVRHEVGDALALPFDDSSFDVVWTQNSGMNIADKRNLYREFLRVLRPGGLLVFQEPMAGEQAPPHYPLMWAEEPSTSFLLAPEAARDLIVGVGFVEEAWEIVTETSPSGTVPTPPAHAVQTIIMGRERLEAIHAANRRNVSEGRTALVHAVFSRPGSPLPGS